MYDKVRKLEQQRENGTVRKVGQRWTVEKWLTHWVENIAAESVSDNTLSGYRVAVGKHLIPGVGAHRIEKKLEPENLETLYRQMMRAGSAAGTAHQAHRTIRTALNEAVRRGHLIRNPATLAKPPSLPTRRSSRTPSRRSRSCSPLPASGETACGGPSPLHSDYGRARRSGCAGRIST